MHVGNRRTDTEGFHLKTAEPGSRAAVAGELLEVKGRSPGTGDAFEQGQVLRQCGVHAENVAGLITRCGVLRC